MLNSNAKKGKKNHNNNKKGDGGGERPGFMYGRVDLLSSNSGDLMVSEMEILDPELFFRLSEAAIQRFCAAVAKRLT